MATAMMPRGGYSTEIKLEYGVPQVFALKFAEGRNVEGKYGPRVLFTAVDERKLWLDAEDGSDLERGMRELGIGAGDFAQVTKIRHPRGGGHSIRVERVDDNDAREPQRKDRDYSPELARSIEAARETRMAARETRRAGASSESGLPTPAVHPATKEKEGGSTQAAAVLPNGSAGSGSRFMSAYKNAIDILLESQAYAKRQGLLLEIRCEDVRCLAATIMIDAKGAR